MRDKLKVRMKERKATVGDLATVLNCSKDYIYKIIAGTRTPIMEDAKKIADYLEDTVDNLFFGNELYETSNGQSAGGNKFPAVDEQTAAKEAI